MKNTISLHKKINTVIIGTLITIAILNLLAMLIPDNEPVTEYQPPYELNSYNYELLNKSAQYYSYEDDTYSSIYGIDISEHNKEIDFSKVKADGIDFVYLRLGWRGYTEGGLNQDKMFETYYRQAKEAGLKIGVYFFSQAINVKEARDEADFVLKRISGKELDLPIAYDYEDAGEDDGRIKDLDIKEITDNAISFLERIRNKGYDAILYTNLHWLNERYDLSRITRYRIWLAQYYDLPTYPYEFEMWQYSENGAVSGISKETDLNIMFIRK